MGAAGGGTSTHVLCTAIRIYHRSRGHGYHILVQPAIMPGHFANGCEAQCDCF
jgi:hypothetical protein